MSAEDTFLLSRNRRVLPCLRHCRMAAHALPACATTPQVFLPLVTRLVNDPSSKCRTMVGAALGVLLRRAAPPRRDRLAQFCVQWLGGGDARLNRAAAQVRSQAGLEWLAGLVPPCRLGRSPGPVETSS